MDYIIKILNSGYSKPIIILVIIWFVISLICVRVEVKNSYECFKFNPSEDDLKGLICHSDDENINVEEFQDTLFIHSEQKLFDLEVCKIEYDFFLNIWEILERDMVAEILDPKECYLLRVNIPEGIPNLAISCRNERYLKIFLPIGYNGREGNISENIKYKITLKAFLLATLKIFLRK